MTFLFEGGMESK